MLKKKKIKNEFKINFDEIRFAARYHHGISE